MLKFITLSIFALAALAGGPGGPPALAAAPVAEAQAQAPAPAPERLTTEQLQQYYNEMQYSQRMILTLQLCILGMIVVLFVLWLLAMVVGWLNLRDQRPLTQAGPTSVVPEAQMPTSAVAGLQPEIAAVITAAVTTFLHGRRFVIKGVTIESDSTWGRLGRQQIHASHAIERKHGS